LSDDCDVRFPATSIVGAAGILLVSEVRPGYQTVLHCYSSLKLPPGSHANDLASAANLTECPTPSVLLT